MDFLKSELCKREEDLHHLDILYPYCLYQHYLYHFYCFHYPIFFFPLKLILVSYVIYLLVATLNAFISSTQNFLSIIILPLSFFSMHFAYGLGSFLGIIYFVNKWRDRQTKDSHFNKEQFLNNNNL